MNTIQASQLLHQMRSLQVEAGGSESRPAAVGGNETQKVDFASVLKQSVDAVNNQSQIASQMATALERGDSNISVAQVMIEAQKASVGFEAMKRVRNDLISAYKEIMSMPI
jgi:flagellar hook-basal body complex protein FliE